MVAFARAFAVVGLFASIAFGAHSCFVAVSETEIASDKKETMKNCINGGHSPENCSAILKEWK